MRWLVILAVLVAGPAGATVRRRAASCTREDFALAVDRAGAALRKLNADNLPRLRAKMRELKEARGWPDAGFEEKAYETLQDERMAALDAQANDLLAKLDALGTVDPVRRARLRQAAGADRRQPRAAGNRQSQGGLHAGQARPDAGRGPRSPRRRSPRAKAAEVPKSETAERARRRRRHPRRNRRARPPQEPAGRRGTKTASARAEVAIAPAAAPAAAVPPPPPARRGAGGRRGRLHHRRDHGGERGASSARCRPTSAPSSSTSSRSSGRPTGYILGTEGGGAFLAGVRYGNGTLYMRAGHAAAEDLLARPLDRHRCRRRRLQDAVPDLQAEIGRARSTRASPASTARPTSSAASAPRSSPTAA